VVIDDTPGAVIVSAFDPLRRELARLALERLVSDGRIHPARIEEVVNQTKLELEAIVKARGEAAVTDLGIIELHPELVRMLGLLYYRTSYGQNLLVHSREVAYLTSLMASELELDPAIARRAGLLHDIGKACDQSQDGPHARVGAEMARRYGESKVVVNAIAAHHEEVPAESPYAFLVSAADALSGGRPGARRESFDAYIKRLEKLEAIALSFRGVEKAYAIQAGREVRIMVEPEKISDEAAWALASQIATRIQAELKYPGQIKVVVVRELRAIEYAR
jgi:ribonuclease Y